jgi:hypothetical protein
MNIPVSILVRSLNLTNCFYKEKGFEVAFGKRTVVASRLGVGNIFGSNFEFQDQWSPDGSINSLGGKQSLRGYRANRFCRAHYGLLI